MSGFKTLLPEKYINLLDDKHLDGPFIDGDLSSIVKGFLESKLKLITTERDKIRHEHLITELE